MGLTEVQYTINNERLNLWAASRGIRQKDGGDYLGCALHALTSEALGHLRLMTYRAMGVSAGRPFAQLYGYATISGAELEKIARRCSPPEHWGVIDFRQYAEREIKPDFQRGEIVRINVLTRPVAMSRFFSRGRWRKEVDVADLLIERDGRNPADRDWIYGEWLAQRLSAAGDLLSEGFEVRHVREAGPAGVNAVLEGDVKIRDPAALFDLLHSGIGRSRAYGHGMLILRPPKYGVRRAA